MASNFDFLEKTDKELHGIIIDSEKLFRDGYFNQSVVQLRIFAEKMAKKISGKNNPDLTFDDVLHCLKDKIEDGDKGERQKEFVDDLFFIKQEGNKCAHGEDADGLIALEAIKRAFEASINYIWLTKNKKNDKIDTLVFDEALLVTQKETKENKLVDKYLELAKQNIEKEKAIQKELEKKPDDKEIEQETKKRVKDRIKEAKKTRKNLDRQRDEKSLKDKNTLKKDSKKSLKVPSKKTKKPNKAQKTRKNVNKNPKNSETFNNFKIMFWVFALFSLCLLIKIIFFM